MRQRLHFLGETGSATSRRARVRDLPAARPARAAGHAARHGTGGCHLRLGRTQHRPPSDDNQRLLSTLRELRDRGNTVIVVEHDADPMRIADELIRARASA